ncbi:type III polyketide synthase [Microaerobacter geothermalis]|uniref:type III polyketide synthase n=1 Tax=Microaerobacter geothermalis TaxID=674972 RepID=UPI001F22C2CA|nr:3-oxoacyl-[acyl-carrier-protein] synthase III C-terminal domain-containing protein [Microaerobacter geothermalis]MCF6093769.1 type III polyketide synthase [Microaerobacter geothermalis]
MSTISSVGVAVPPYRISQDLAKQLVKKLFNHSFRDIDRLLTVFENSQIETRYFSVPPKWFEQDHDQEEKNRLYIETAERLGMEAINKCLDPINLHPSEIDYFIFVSTTGFATPSMDARLINLLNMKPQIKRTPIWGLGCAGGAVGLTRAYEYARAFPDSIVLVLAIELCGLTFLQNDHSKSNLIGTSLFADGAAAVLVMGHEALHQRKTNLAEIHSPMPQVVDTMSTTWKDSLDVMGWDITNSGLKVIFSRDIPSIVNKWMKSNVLQFLDRFQLSMDDIRHFITHPGGMKVIAAYEESLGIPSQKLSSAKQVLKDYGNMSSPTVLFVLQQVLESPVHKGDYGLIAALGPGFSSELLLVQWN